MLQDIIAEILSRLPVKSLLRFKAVCTQWRALISSPFFVSLHLNRSRSNLRRHSIIVQLLDSVTAFDPVTFSPVTNFSEVSSFGKGISFVGSINGLICIYCHFDKWLWLWNPSTRLFKTLPTGAYKQSFVLSVGFGCDPNNVNDYKVVMIGKKCREGEEKNTWVAVWSTWVAVWSANSGCWTDINVSCNFIPRTVCDVTVKGFAYWIVIVEQDCGAKSLVASFDMSAEVLKLHPVPEFHSEYLYDFYGLVWKENFALAVLEGMRIYHVWTIENDCAGKECWSKKFTFDFNYISCWPTNTISAGNGKIVAASLEGLVLCDLETRTANIEKEQHVAAGAHYYVESLLSGKGFSRLGENAKVE